MKIAIATLIALATAALAAPIAERSTDSTTTLSSSAATYTAPIDTGSESQPPPLWDPPTPPAPPLFEAPKEDLPLVPQWLVSVHKAPVQAVRVEKLAPFTGASVQPLNNIYAPSASDEEGKFAGEGSLRPARMTVYGCVSTFVRSWIWWISVVVVAAVLVYVAEKMFIGSVRAARKARSASRVARSRAASLMQGTRTRAASLLGDGRRGRAGTMQEKGTLNFTRSPSQPAMSKGWNNGEV